MDELTVGEMFAGVGGFRLPLEKTGGYRVVWANEWDKFACQVYRKHFGDKELVEGDICEVKANEIPEFDVLTAGFPCPSFSIAGRRKGISESRGALFVQIVRVASAKRPKFLLLENVRGLLSSDNGRAFAIILRALGSLGYILQWEVVNSKHFGVAQNRERVYIVGCLGKECFREVFPIPENIGCVGTSFGEASVEGTRVRSANPQVANTLSSRYGKDGSENLIQVNDDRGSQVNRIYSPEGLSPTVPTACGGSHIPKISTHVTDEQDGTLDQDEFHALRFVRTDEAKRVRSESMRNGKDNTPYGRGFRTLTECWENVTGAVTGALNRDTLVGNAGRIRMLTPRECERLQGFPDDWTLEGLTREGKSVLLSDTQRYKLLGNAVTTNVVHFIGERLCQ